MMSPEVAQPKGMSRAILALIFVFVILVWPVIFFGIDSTSEAWDQNQHHLIVIRKATATFVGAANATPIWELMRDYPSATGPGYHLFLSLFGAIGLGDLTILRLISSLFGMALVVSVWKILARRVDQWTALALSAPLLCSPYLLSGSMWLTTDVAATWLMVLAMGAVLVANPSATDRIRGGIFACLGVLVRQPTTWLVAPLFVSGAVANRRSWSRQEVGSWILSCVLPLAVLAGLILLWGGLTPPAYRSMHDAGANFATPAFALSLVGVWGIPWAIALRRIAPKEKRALSWSMAGGGAFGLLCAVVPETSFDQAAGRWGGPLWSFVQIAPTLVNRSLLLLVLAPVGGIVLGRLLCHAWVNRGSATAAVLGVAIAAMLSATTVNSQCWERYIDLPLLALLPMMVVIGVNRIDLVQLRWVRTASVILALIQIGLSVWMVYRSTFFGSLDR